ncbi:response regulator [Rufibacter immobilis]|uniref:response regulator n=1 Tax=Rufibacter immobilis TaxID=1348778 RepID=UPI0035EF0309
MKKVSKVLLVDDDPTAIFISLKLLKKMGVAEEFETANNGLAAFDFIRTNCLPASGTPTNCPELILLDIKMPVMDGFEFLEAFRQLDLSPMPQVIMLTSSMHPKEIERARNLNVVGFLTKPLTQTALINVLEENFKD